MPKAVIERTLSGSHSLVLMPTGGGKSLCFQVPALVLAKRSHPSKDPRPPFDFGDLSSGRFDEGSGRYAGGQGIDAAMVNSLLDRSQREDRYRRIQAGEFTLLYVTPERFRKPDFLEVLRSRKIVLMAVDEAHCISEWDMTSAPTTRGCERFAPFSAIQRRSL